MLNVKENGFFAEGGIFMSRWHWFVLFLVAALQLFAGNSSLLVTDNVEANYALTAKEMVLSGDWLSPQIYGHYWYDKPIFFYWLTALAYKLFGFTEFASRFFPALFGLASMGLLAWGGIRLYNAHTGFYSALILVSSVEFFLISKSIITDAVLFFFFSATLLYFYLGYREGKARYWYLMYAAAGFAVLTKGPIGVLLPGLIITIFLLWQRDWRVLLRAHLFSGTLLCFFIAVPWYAAMYALHGQEFLTTFFGTHNFLRATVSEHPRDNVFYYYALVNILALFPWSGLIPGMVYDWWHGERQSLNGLQKFLLVWALVVFCFFQCMATKYITYTYPLLFPASLLLGSLLAKQEEGYITRKYLVGVSIGFIILLAAAYWTAKQGLVAAEHLLLLPLSLFVACLLAYALFRKNNKKAYALACTAVLFYMALIYSIAIPFSHIRSAKALGTMLVQIRVGEAGLYGSYPTSAVFYSDARLVKLLPERELAAYKPKGMSWSSKNVMPYAAMERNAYPLVIVSEKSVSDFLQKNKSAWVMAGRSSRYVLLRSENKQGKLDEYQLKCYNKNARLSAKNNWRNHHGRT